MPAGRKKGTGDRTGKKKVVTYIQLNVSYINLVREYKDMTDTQFSKMKHVN